MEMENNTWNQGGVKKKEVILKAIDTSGDKNTEGKHNSSEKINALKEYITLLQQSLEKSKPTVIEYLDRRNKALEYKNKMKDLEISLEYAKKRLEEIKTMHQNGNKEGSQKEMEELAVKMQQSHIDRINKEISEYANASYDQEYADNNYADINKKYVIFSSEYQQSMLDLENCKKELEELQK